jgi:hypothetical protein
LLVSFQQSLGIRRWYWNANCKDKEANFTSVDHVVEHDFVDLEHPRQV